MLNKTDFPLSNHDLEHMTQQLKETPNIKTVEQVLKCNSLDQLFNNSGKCILWYSYDGTPNNAHWLIIIRNINTKHKYVYFFDSFSADNILNKDPALKKHLILLCKKADYILLANDVIFQSKKSNVCGRYVLIVYGLNKLNIPPNEIENILKNINEKQLINIIS